MAPFNAMQKTNYTLRKFWRYSKDSLRELVPLEILDKHWQGLRNMGSDQNMIWFSPGLTQVGWVKLV